MFLSLLTPSDCHVMRHFKPVGLYLWFMLELSAWRLVLGCASPFVIPMATSWVAEEDPFPLELGKIFWLNILLARKCSLDQPESISEFGTNSPNAFG